MEDKTKFELRNLVIPAYAYKDNRLNWTSARVYGFIHSYTNPFFFSDEHLAEMFGVHEDTIKTAVAQLKEFEYIETEHRAKAGGGKIRRCFDRRGENTPSKGAKTPLGSGKVEATKGSKHPYKGKDNNIKVENFGKGDVDSEALVAKREAVEYRNSRKGKGLGGYSQSQYAKQSPVLYPKRGGTFDATDIK